MKIIDQDIDFWTATVENHERCLYRCCPQLEPKYEALLESAKVVRAALQAYRRTVELYK